MTGLIIDDNEQDILQLKQALTRLDPLLKIDSTLNPFSALHQIRETTYDVIFLDMDMPELKGLNIAREIDGRRTPIIIVSAFPEYAVESVQFRPFDYLLKPVSLVKLRYAMLRVKEYIEDIGSKHYVRLQTGKNHFIQCPVDNILYIEAIGDYQKVWTEDEVFTILSSMDQLTKHMIQYDFIRIHRSYLVNPTMLKEILPKHVIIRDKKIPIGRSYRQNVSKLVG